MAAKVDLLTATTRDALELAPRMRDADVFEVRASGNYEPEQALLASMRYSERSWTLRIDDEIAAMWGIAPHPWSSFLAPAGIPWLLTSDVVDREWLVFARLCKPVVAEVMKKYHLLENQIHAQHTVALRWARWVGFEVESPRPFGPFNELFCRIHIGMKERS